MMSARVKEEEADVETSVIGGADTEASVTGVAGTSTTSCFIALVGATDGVWS